MSSDAAANKSDNAGQQEAPELAQNKAFGHTFWMLNSIEAFERLAYFGIRSVVPIYIMQATEPGGLHLTAVHKGVIYAWWAILQSWLPMFTGGVADRYGYKRVLFFAISANVIGYLLMAFLPFYEGFFAGILLLAAGTAFFKPALQGSLAQNLNKENSSLGWGIFYWVVNIGAVTAPILATMILGKPHSAEGWRNLFIASAVYTSMNLLLLLTFKDVPSGADKNKSLADVFRLTVENIWPFWFKGGKWHPVRGPVGTVVLLVGLAILIVSPLKEGAFPGWIVNYQGLFGFVLFIGGALLATWLMGGEFHWQLRLPAFLAIMSCFWMMMYQVWDLHPNFIEDWVDSEKVAAYAPQAWREYGDLGRIRVPQQILLNLNAALIVALILPISWIVRRMRTLEAMLIGMTVATAGTLVAGWTGNGWILLLGIVFFSLGEMLTGPKKNQYLGLIAPPGKKGLYLGYVNIPVGVGVGLGSLIAGFLYDGYGERAGIALKELATQQETLAKAAQRTDWSDSLEFVPDLLGIDRADALEFAAEEMGVSQTEAAKRLREVFRYDAGQVQNLAMLYVATHEEDPKVIVQKIVDSVKKARKVEELTEVINEANLARYTGPLPEALDRKPFEALNVAGEHMMEQMSFSPNDGMSRVYDELWKLYGENAYVLENLALEYLAQGTDRMRQAVLDWEFEYGVDQRGKRIKELEAQMGIGRTKTFAAYAAANGASDAEIDQTLGKIEVSTGDEVDKRFVYLLTEHDHYRYLAIAKKDWSNDLGFLQELVAVDDQVKEVVRAKIDEVGFFGSIASGIKRVFAGDSGEDDVIVDDINYTKLGYNQDLIQEALEQKDWTVSSAQARKLLKLNPYEAKALVGAEVANAPVKMTEHLWTKYQPNIKVWVPFAVIGVLATIALAIFGQMAKKWADMDA